MVFLVLKTRSSRLLLEMAENIAADNCNLLGALDTYSYHLFKKKEPTREGWVH